MLDELFYDECRQIEADNIWPDPKVPDWGNLVINLEIIGTGQFLKGAFNLFLYSFVSIKFSSMSFRAIALLRGSVTFLVCSMAKRRARSFELSILDSIFASRLLGRNTLAMATGTVGLEVLRDDLRSKML